MPLRTLNDLLVEQLRDLYNAETQYRDILASMTSSARDEDLRRELTEISRDTDKNIGSLQRACQLLAVDPTGVTCQAMRGLVRETEETLSDFGDGYVIDAALIANAQRIAHYEIAGFGTARQFARILDNKDVAKILDELAERAGSHDHELTRVANGGWFRHGVNEHAEAGTR